MPLKLADITLDPPVFLAPLAGVTDPPFRNLVAGFGAGLVVSEMVASREVMQAKSPARARMRADPCSGEGVTAIQIAGRDAGLMADCARYCEDRGARIIDINMGCPARKVTGGYSGSALMKDLDHALRLIDAVVGAVSIPVTLKCRLGWDDAGINVDELAVRAEAAGIAMLTVHGRTRQQFYKGRADWARIREVAARVEIPVIANGDIVSTDTARRARAASGAAGLMVGRGAAGRPWLLAEIAHALYCGPAPEIPSGRQLSEMIATHYEAILSYYGAELGLRNARKHLGWYMDGLATPADLRRRMLTSRTPAEVLRLIADLGAAAPTRGESAAA